MANQMIRVGRDLKKRVVCIGDTNGIQQVKPETTPGCQVVYLLQGPEA